VIKTIIMRGAGHVALMGRGEECTWFWWGSLRKRPMGRPRRRWGILLRWIFRKYDVGVWTGFSWLRIETGDGHLRMR
jgi:hypothetical protein